VTGPGVLAAASGRWVERRLPYVAIGVTALALALVGGLSAPPPPPFAEGERIAGRGHLLERPRPGPFGASVEVEMGSGRAAGMRLLIRLPRESRLPERAGAGAELALSGRFHAARRSPDDGFDFPAHLRRRGVVGELRADRARFTGRLRGGWAGRLDAVRRRADAALGSGLDPPEAELARGMVLGADEAIPATVKEDFRDSGLSHLLAVSGQNVLLLGALALSLLAALGLGHAARIAVLLALIALYVPLTGAGPSIQRAGVMGAASLVAMAAARPLSRWYALGLAACVTLALEPLAYGDPGWQLSFAAVAGILLVAPIMWLGMLRAGLGQLLGLGGPLGAAAAHVNGALGRCLAPLLDGLERIAALFADAPGAHVALPIDGWDSVAAAYGLLAVAVVAARRGARRLDTRASTAVAYVRRLPRRRRALLAVGAALIVALTLARGLAPPPLPGTLTVTFLDVGQGDATLIQHPDGSAVLFDGGPPEGGAARLLRRAGVRRLSAVVMTHASRDHHGGLREVVERFPVGLLVDGGDGTRDRDFQTTVAAARARGVRRIAGLAPLTFRAGALRVDVLSPLPRPPGPPPADPNPRAVVAVVASDGFELLLSGDAESETLLGLPLPDVDAIKVPHHGSADPGLPEVLERLRPEIASIPVGENDYGHPAPSTVAALRNAGVSTCRNDRDGSIRVTVGRGRVEVDPQRGGTVALAP
jgi:competence protein ComEC